MPTTLKPEPDRFSAALTGEMETYFQRQTAAFGFTVHELHTRDDRRDSTISLFGENTHLVIGNLTAALASHDEISVEKYAPTEEKDAEIRIVIHGVSIAVVKMIIASQLALLWRKRKERIVLRDD